jgi:hypothetical protein
MPIVPAGSAAFPFRKTPTGEVFAEYPVARRFPPRESTEMFAYDERVEASKKFVHQRWIAVDGEWRRAPIAGLWATVVPLGRQVFEILIEKDDELHCRTVVRRKRRCQSLLEAKEYAWECFEPHLEAARESRLQPAAPVARPKSITRPKSRFIRPRKGGVPAYVQGASMAAR